MIMVLLASHNVNRFTLLSAYLVYCGRCCHVRLGDERGGGSHAVLNSESCIIHVSQNQISHYILVLY